MPLDFSHLPPLQSQQDAGVEAPASRPSMKWPMIAAALGSVGDNVSTNTTPPSWQETNPLLPNDHVANAMAQGATALASLLLIRKLGVNHPKLAQALGYGLGGLGAADTAINVYRVRKYK